MLEHIDSCPGLSKGLYQCCGCNASERISKVHKRGCKERLPRRHTFTGILDQVRKGLSRPSSAQFPFPSEGPAQKQSNSWAEKQNVYPGKEICSEDYTGPQELSSETGPCELDAPNWLPMQIFQQDCPAGLEVAYNYDADNIFPLEEEPFGPGALYQPMGPHQGPESPPPYNFAAPWVTEKTSICDPAQVQASHPIHAIGSSRLPDGNTSLNSEHPTYELSELPDTSSPCEPHARYDTSCDSSFDGYQVTGNPLATSSRPSNSFQCSSFEASCLQPTRSVTKYEVDKQRLTRPSVDSSSSSFMVSSVQRQLYADPTAPLASSNRSDYHWSSSAYNQHLFGSSSKPMADCDVVQRPSSPSNHPYHHTGFVSPVGSDTSLDHNVIVSPTSSISSSIDQRLAENIHGAETNQASLHYGNFQFQSAPGHTEQVAFTCQGLPDSVMALGLPESSPISCGFENSIAGPSQNLLTHEPINQEQLVTLILFIEDHAYNFFADLAKIKCHILLKSVFVRQSISDCRMSLLRGTARIPHQSLLLKYQPAIQRLIMKQSSLHQIPHLPSSELE